MSRFGRFEFSLACETKVKSSFRTRLYTNRTACRTVRTSVRRTCFGFTWIINFSEPVFKLFVLDQRYLPLTKLSLCPRITNHQSEFFHGHSESGNFLPCYYHEASLTSNPLKEPPGFPPSTMHTSEWRSCATKEVVGIVLRNFPGGDLLPDYGLNVILGDRLRIIEGTPGLSGGRGGGILGI